jgi:guanylate kinase
MSGTLIIVSAPSGAGKTSLVNALLECSDRLMVSCSYTTRPKRANENNGKAYHFIDESTYEQMQQTGAFLEHARVFDYGYGTSKAWVMEKLSQDIDIILEIDWQGAQQVRAQFPCVGIYIIPPSYEALESRLRARQQDSEAVIQKRLAGARQEIMHYPEYDYLVINDDFEQALSDLKAIYHAARCQTGRQASRHAKWLDRLTDFD